jgi:hypothetical protein
MRFLYRGTGADRQETVPPRLPAFIRLERGKRVRDYWKGERRGKGARIVDRDRRSASHLPICSPYLSGRGGGLAHSGQDRGKETIKRPLCTTAKGCRSTASNGNNLTSP